jgi:hypothetical protein
MALAAATRRYAPARLRSLLCVVGALGIDPGSRIFYTEPAGVGFRIVLPSCSDLLQENAVSEKEAMMFIEAVGRSAALKRRIAELLPDARLSDVVLLAAENGFSFSEAQLRRAFVRDWKIRRLFGRAK